MADDTCSLIPNTSEPEIEHTSRFRLKQRRVDQTDIEKKLLLYSYVPIEKLAEHVAQWRSIYVTKKPSDQWATIGIVDRCITRKQYMVVRLTDMRGMHAHLFITGKAFDALYDKINKTTVLGIFEPSIVWSSELRADVAIQASQTKQLLVIGTSYDLVQCIQHISLEKQCENMVDGRSGNYCDRHLERLCKRSKNTRMELASGDSALEIRWARVSKTPQGDVYESASRTQSNTTAKKKEFTYTIKGLGSITSDGVHLQTNKIKSKEEMAAKKKELTEFLRGRTDPGAEMLRLVNGIQDDRPKSPALSKDAMMKMGLSTRQVLTREEAAAKKRSIDALLKTTANKEEDPQKKQRYVYL
ncbi:predicted protein [Lichtheimia corymbifera JMRC:FSU:9682]|uniref:MCM10 OB-fold domain-containing protein n=1 Tax=Lichtheimia corymbifera JMRC:FSU:9682 TaxID=1263082 RepID=A0A068RL57_9FUNG|nr:predicted protein [Lichtheimia corymbifera JMRC:FSU:9682]